MAETAVRIPGIHLCSNLHSAVTTPERAAAAVKQMSRRSQRALPLSFQNAMGSRSPKSRFSHPKRNSTYAVTPTGHPFLTTPRPQASNFALFLQPRPFGVCLRILGMLGFPLRLCEVMGSRFALGRGRFRRETRADRLLAPPELPEKSGTPTVCLVFVLHFKPRRYLSGTNLDNTRRRFAVPSTQGTPLGLADCGE